MMSDPTRAAAFDLLTAVLDRGRPIEEALDSLPVIDARDRAAAHRLAASVLRRLGTLDAVMEPFLTKRPPVPVRHVLRLGAAALLLLDAPPHAAVATAVELARAKGLAPFTGLVNAVLRRIAAGGATAFAELDAPRLDTPSWLWSAWGRDARAIATAHQHEAPIDLTLAPGVAAPLGGTVLPTGSWRYPPGTRIAELAGFAEGGFWVQDAAAALPARMLEAEAGELIADLCAAPGGKTAQLAAGGARVIAVERDAKRIDRLRENLTRLGLHPDIVHADATTWQPPELLDAVLLDAPCSATGTIRRHPDVLHIKRASDIGALTKLQDKLLDAACAMLRPGGRLVYAVCSLLPAEGAARIDAALARLPLRLVPIPANGFGMPEAVTGDFTLRTTPALWPDLGGLDGFFAARLERI